MTKTEYLTPELEVLLMSKSLHILSDFSLDGHVEDFDGPEIQGF